MFKESFDVSRALTIVLRVSCVQVLGGGGGGQGFERECGHTGSIANSDPLVCVSVRMCVCIIV